MSTAPYRAFNHYILRLFCLCSPSASSWVLATSSDKLNCEWEFHYLYFGKNKRKQKVQHIFHIKFQLDFCLFADFVFVLMKNYEFMRMIYEHKQVMIYKRRWWSSGIWWLGLIWLAFRDPSGCRGWHLPNLDQPQPRSEAKRSWADGTMP